MSEQQSKWLAKSLTVWGGVVLVLPTIGRLAGWDFAGYDFAELQTAGEHVLLGLNAVVGSLMVLYGRARAKGSATILPSK